MLQGHDLTLVRGGCCLARGLNFELRAGQALWVQGPNGSGKTTLLRTLCGLRPVQRGQVSWRGQALPGAGDSLREEVAFVGHRDGLHDDLSAHENLQVALSLGGEPAAPKAVDAALDAAGLAAVRRLPARHLSQGQRRRAALARLRLTRKRLWVLDEPLAALDAAARDELSSALLRHLAGGGLAVFTCHSDSWSHIDSIQRLCLPGSR